jgi:hypothetical protein
MRPRFRASSIALCDAGREASTPVEDGFAHRRCLPASRWSTLRTAQPILVFATPKAAIQAEECMREDRCPNFNHGRSQPPVHACPSCGGVVNARILVKNCSEAQHGQRRRNGDAFCVDCATRLRVK